MTSCRYVNLSFATSLRLLCVIAYVLIIQKHHITLNSPHMFVTVTIFNPHAALIYFYHIMLIQ